MKRHTTGHSLVDALLAWFEPGSFKPSEEEEIRAEADALVEEMRRIHNTATLEERKRCARIVQGMAEEFHKIAADRRTAGKSSRADGARAAALGKARDAIQRNPEGFIMSATRGDFTK